VIVVKSADPADPGQAGLLILERDSQKWTPVLAAIAL
jgi:hypothetical protein